MQVSAFLFVVVLAATLGVTPLTADAGPFEDRFRIAAIGDDFSKGAVAYDAGAYAMALKFWRPLAEQGHVKAQSFLGLMYDEGQGVTKNDAEAVRWYRKAAEQGHALAQTSLGYKYMYGRGVPQNDAVAAHWWRKAAEQGHAPAQLSLGLAYTTGRGVKRDYSEAMHWYRKGAEQRLSTAQFLLGAMYASGRGVTQDYAEAANWFGKAAEQGDAEIVRNVQSSLSKLGQNPGPIDGVFGAQTKAALERLAADDTPASSSAFGIQLFGLPYPC